MPTSWGFPNGTSGKESACQCRRHKRFRFDPWARNIPWRRKWQVTPVFLPGNSQGQRRLEGYSSWSPKESSMSEVTVHACIHMYTSVQLLSSVQLFATPWNAACQASLSITNLRRLLKLMSIESVMPANYFNLIPFFTCLQSFPASGSFPMSQFLASGGQSIGASASVPPMNIQE